jgi:Ca-activated chloride channel family protein
MTRMKTLAPVLAIFLSTLAPLAAQNPVSLLFTVEDKKGRFITDLGKDEFEVVENKKPQTILEFASESNLPLRLAILIDAGNIVRDRFRFQQDAALEFIDAVVRPRGLDQALVMSFGVPPEVVADLTDSREKLCAAVRTLRPGGGSALYEAISIACRDKLLQPGESPEKYRRALVIFSAGEDSQSRFTRDQALEAAQRANAIVYTISANNTKAETNGDKALRFFAQETGGQAFDPQEAEDLGQPFENIANELRHQYRLIYRPQSSKADGLFHPVEIRLKGHKDLVVRARRGYYASADSSSGK